MTEEIKEILDDLRTYKDRYEYFLFNNLSFSDRDYKAKILLDYITNLQEENEKNKEYSDFYKHMTDKWKDMSDMFKKSCNDYKSRNEKALDKLYCYGEVFDSKILQQFQKEMENILQGEDKDE